ncbi:MAG: hypothetical protein AAF517_04555 [Planctomycetota bacterium]
MSSPRTRVKQERKVVLVPDDGIRVTGPFPTRAAAWRAADELDLQIVAGGDWPMLVAGSDDELPAAWTISRVPRRGAVLVIDQVDRPRRRRWATPPPVLVAPRRSER